MSYIWRFAEWLEGPGFAVVCLVLVFASGFALRGRLRNEVPMTISKNTAVDVALAYREIESAEALLQQIIETIDRHEEADIRDAFGRRRGLQLGVPSGADSHRMFDVPWTLAKPIIEAHIIHHKTRIVMLSEKAREELAAP